MDTSEDIVRLISGLSSETAVRQLAESVLTKNGTPLQDIQPLFSALANPATRSWKERVVAAWALGRTPLGPQERDAAVGMLLEVLETAHRDGRWRQLGRAVIRYPIFLPACMIFDVNAFNLPIITVVGLPVWSLGYVAYSKTCENRLRAAAAESLGHIPVLDSVGALTGALFDRNARVREAAATALHRVLPTLAYEHLGLLGTQSIANLGRALSHNDSLLVFKVLEALAKVGTSQVIPDVERLAMKGRTVRIRDCAYEVLTLLRSRQQGEAEAKTLMRAASGPVQPTYTPQTALQNRSEDLKEPPLQINGSFSRE